MHTGLYVILGVCGSGKSQIGANVKRMAAGTPLLDSQLAIPEEPSPDDHAWVCDITEPAHATVAGLLTRASP